MNKREFEQLHRMIPACLAWYETNRRDLPWRKDPTPYHILLSEIIFQQTRIEAGTAYYLRFLEEAPDLRTLAEMEEEKLLKLWEGLGYYSRARNLQKAARLSVDSYGGTLPADPKELEKFPGVGPYTAGAIASIAFGLPVPAVDGNVLRVLSRLLGRKDDIALPETKKRFETELASLYSETGHLPAGDLNQALMDIGATVCLPNGIPRCDDCPLREFCTAKEKGLQEELPVKGRPKARRIEERTVFVFRSPAKDDSPESEFYLRKRAKKGLLAGLWELPGEEGFLEEAEVVFRYGERVAKLPDAKHVFSHVEWHMKGYLVDVEKERFPETEEAVWRTSSEIKKGYAIPSAFRRYTKYIE